MKHLRKSILTLLALTLFGGAGAWAQGQLLTTINASSSFTNGTQTFDNIVTVTLNGVVYSANYGWYGPGSPCPVEVAPVNGVTVTGYMLYFSATDPMEFEGSSFTVALEGNRVLANDLTTQLGSVGITKIEVYGAPAAIELTKEGANQWTLGQTPDYDLELQVEYYEAHALKDIPAGWTVKINGVPQAKPYQGDSLMITETDSVTLVPAGNPRRVKSVTLEDEAPATVLSGALVDGATIKVNFKWEGATAGDYVQGVYNAASGTFTASNGGNNWGSQGDAVYKVEKSGDNIIIGAGIYDYSGEGMVWTFNTTNDTYTTTNGDMVNDNPGAFGLISVTLNGTDITSQLTAQ